MNISHILQTDGSNVSQIKQESLVIHERFLNHFRMRENYIFQFNILPCFTDGSRIRLLLTDIFVGGGV